MSFGGRGKVGSGLRGAGQALAAAAHVHGGKFCDMPTVTLTCALRRTVMFVDEAGQQVSEKRLQLVQG